eukprot:2647477-Rhodomonas_salina.2
MAYGPIPTPNTCIGVCMPSTSPLCLINSVPLLASPSKIQFFDDDRQYSVAIHNVLEMKPWTSFLLKMKESAGVSSDELKKVSIKV